MILALAGGAFLQGLLGSLHCPAMCGSFAHTLGATQGRWSVLIAYNVSRSISYAAVGMLLGLSGTAVNYIVTTGAAAIAGGVLLILVGLAVLFPRFSVFHIPGFIVRPLTGIMKSGRGARVTAAGFGLLSGFLPCGVLWPAYVLALSAGVYWIGALVMVSFSLGTYPAMMLIGLTGGFMRGKLSQPGWRLAFASVIVLFGLFTIWQHGAIGALCHVG